ncbi:M3 family oligoendopeptidase [archaeon]|mgnify:CR=1 FL=1|jgi:oligoendopeptidase F|nr:M3 family oligoendopeptidase [archaeon]MBT3451480.1 M3 family oligoendopeptidase [archaeon]MBT6869730.1 M3 family oligoendopeptidase [archaeon]MBT7192685.1 M3 family oligoendopeptidase [archaeon]MBT7380710.1 M3 family oligoendopeptidase [archaeon]
MVKKKTTKFQNQPLQWNLNDILKSEKEFNTLLKQSEQRMNSFVLIRKKLDPKMSDKEFKKIVLFLEKLKEDLSRLSAYSSLLISVNIKDQKARLQQSKLDILSVKLSDESRFLGHWLKGLSIKNLKRLDDKNANRLFRSIPKMTHYFQRMRSGAKYTLRECEEAIIHRKDITGVEVINELYDLIVNDFEYKFIVKSKIKSGKNKGKIVKTEKVIKSQSELTSHVRSTKPEERKAAYQALFQPYEKNIDKFFQIYSAIAKDWKMESELRKYKSSISVRNFANNIPDEVIEVLLKVCTDKSKIYHQYFNLKAKMLGMKKLKRYDIYAPVTNSKEKISFKEAQKIVFDTFQEFSPDFADKAKQVIDKKHLDSHPKKNKRNGAFCMSIIPSVHPYVLTNFNGKMRDVSTLAHELGHAVHDIYASNNFHSASHAPLPLCETASTFAEMIVFEKLLSKVKSKKEKVAMLMDKVGDSYATIIRQNYFIKFEMIAHEMLSKGITEQQLSDRYIELLKEQFGDSVNVNEEFRHEWSYIPHIHHSPFYCYAYNFGELLSLALFAKYKKEGKEFIPKFVKILSAGGSQDPIKLLASINVDITSEKFWKGGFEIVEGWMKELTKDQS